MISTSFPLSPSNNSQQHVFPPKQNTRSKTSRIKGSVFFGIKKAVRDSSVFERRHSSFKQIVSAIPDELTSISPARVNGNQVGSNDAAADIAKSVLLDVPAPVKDVALPPAEPAAPMPPILPVEASPTPARGVTLGDELVSPKTNLAYRVVKKLGAGSNATVYKVECMSNKATVIYAMKVSRKDLTSCDFQRQEERFIKRLNQPPNFSVIQLFDGFSYKGQRCTIFEHLFIDLRAYLDELRKKKMGVGLPFVQEITKQLAKGLVILSLNEVIHCDLKLSNILLTKPSVCKIRIADFGLSQSTTKERKNYSVQSLCYRAPEVAMGHAFDVKVDIWSLGCALIELYTNAPLFKAKSNKKDIQIENQSLLLTIAEILGPAAANELKLSLRMGCFSKDEAFLLQFEQFQTSQLASIVLKNSEASSEEKLFLDLLEKIFKINPNERISAEEILAHPFCAEQPIVPLDEESKISA